jgi:hypothetical protein
MTTKRYELRYYWSRSLRQKAWQVWDTVAGQWVYETLHKPAAVRRCKELNEREQAQEVAA